MSTKGISGNQDFLNTSNNSLNVSVDEGVESALHMALPTSEMTGFVWVEQLRSVDIRARGYTKIRHLNYADCIQVMDVVKNIFEYV